MKKHKISLRPSYCMGHFLFLFCPSGRAKIFRLFPIGVIYCRLTKLYTWTFYGLLTWLILWGKTAKYCKSRQNSGTKGGISFTIMLVVAAFSSGFGWFIEWFQGAYCQDRMSDVMDGIANTIGAVIGLLAFVFYQKKINCSRQINLPTTCQSA